MFVVAKHNNANQFAYVLSSGGSSNGWYGIQFDTRTQKRIAYCLGNAGAAVGVDMSVRDATTTKRVLSLICEGPGGNITGYRDGADEYIAAAHATQTYIDEYPHIGAGNGSGGSGQGAMVFRALCYNGILSQSDHDAIAAALVSLYIP